VHRVQLTTDGYGAYLDAVEDAFAGQIDYAQLVKIYGVERSGEARYSPAQCMGTHRAAKSYDADANAPVHAVDQRIFQED